jgi:hypothetical protein
MNRSRPKTFTRRVVSCCAGRTLIALFVALASTTVATGVGLAADGHGAGRQWNRASRPAAQLAPRLGSHVCARDDVLSSACDLVASYFRAINAGRYSTACAMLGAQLLLETGGESCRRALAVAGRQRFRIVGAGQVTGGVGVVVAVGLHELGHVRMLRWLALVGDEGGQLKILATRRVA